ncbi:MAG: DNA topoisomerase III [Clostridiales bacterium]|nr:DNA topoisomerase III [Clostridiales bacterium]
MSKTLVVAEKPSVGRDIARSLKCVGKGDGFLYSDAYIVSWAIGHLVTLCEPDDYDKSYKTWRDGVLPIIPGTFRLKAIASVKSQLNALKKLFNAEEVSDIICATDSGREGELIFRYIYEYFKCKKAVRRLWISSMTDEAIKEGFANLTPGSDYDNLYQSAKCRSEADWLVGINATRAYTLRFKALLSIGRVQTPTLALIAARQAEINNFVVKDYWEVRAEFSYGISDERYAAKWFDKETGKDRFFDKDSAKAVADKVAGQTGAVETVETERKNQPPGLLYDLTELQRDCNKKFGYSASLTLDIAQSLYEKRKLITYPRSDSRYIGPDALPSIQKAFRNMEKTGYGEFVGNLPEQPVYRRVVDKSKVTDHHAIIPTDKAIRLDALSSGERNVYDLVARKTISVYMPYYVYDSTKIVTTVRGEHFLTRGKIIVSPGWTALYAADKDGGADKSEEAVLPSVSQGDAVSVFKSSAVKKKTAPPKPYTEATLLSAMENAGREIDDEELRERMKNSGLGTPATRAAIIERIIKVGYVRRAGKTLLPTEKGEKLVAIVPDEIKSPVTTGKWEKGLYSIALGTMSSERFMNSINRYVVFLVDNARASLADIKFAEERRRKKAPAGQTPSGQTPSRRRRRITQ